MAIRFTCPACKSTYAVNDRLAGKKAECKACGQRLQVPPQPPRAMTVLGELVPPAPPTPATAPEPDQPDPTPVPLPPPLPVRTRRALPAGLIAFGIVGAVFLVAALGIVALVLARGGRGDGGGPAAVLAGLGRPGADREGRAWEYADLVTYLKRNGYPGLETEHGEDSGSITLIVGRPPEVPPRYTRDGAEMNKRVEVRDLGAEFDAAKFNRNLADDERVFNWAWGRFTFFARHPLVLSKLRKALEG
jgi:predicted Zn finger-like uncharacterized protein